MLKISKYNIDRSFEETYIDVRTRENRILTIEEIKQLPFLETPPISKEWKCRIKSTSRLVSYIENKQPDNVLDLGCGNGWLINRVAGLAGKVHGIDINLSELRQAQEVLRNFDNVELSYCNILEEDINDKYDLIIINGTIQYFESIHDLFMKLFDILKKNGEVHIVDSPIYSKRKSKDAKTRSDQYYKTLGHPEMSKYYYHHNWDEFLNFGYTVWYNPYTFKSRCMRKMGIRDSPFPWIVVSKIK